MNVVEDHQLELRTPDGAAVLDLAKEVSMLCRHNNATRVKLTFFKITFVASVTGFPRERALAFACESASFAIVSFMSFAGQACLFARSATNTLLASSMLLLSSEATASEVVVE